MPGATTRLGLYKPGGGSTGTITPDEVADIDKLNENFDKIDAAIGATICTSLTRPATPYEGQFIRETDTTKVLVRSGGQWRDIAPGAILIGTTAVRDAAYPAPGSAAARVALANQIVRFWNTDKGYEQQYFAQFDDTGATSSTPTKAAHGWAPSQPRVLLPNYTISKDGGVGTVTKKGARAEFAAVATIALDSIFSNYPEFEEFEIDYINSASSVDLSMVFSFRAAAANAGAAQYTFSYRESAPGVGAEGSGSAATTATLNRTATSGGVMTMRIFNPMSTSRAKFWTFQSHDRTGYSRVGGGSYNVPGTAFDGFRIYSGNAGSTQTGDLFVYGINRP